MTPTPGLPDPYRLIGTSSFAEVLTALQPDRLSALHDLSGAATLVPHGTTIVSLRTAEGVVMAGDRRATMGNVIAQHDIEKVFVADDHSVIGIAGAAGLAVELVRLFQVELEHYEKIEGLPLSLDGKANRLATLLRSNLGLALQGLAVVPLFAGFDLARETGRIFSYDPTGGRYEEHDFYAVGSGSTFARGSLKKLFRRGAPAAEAVRTALEALYDAADDDSATAGPDMARGIYPVVAVVDSSGARVLPEAEIAPVVQAMVDARMLRPDGGPQGEESGS